MVIIFHSHQLFEYCVVDSLNHWSQRFIQLVRLQLSFHRFVVMLVYGYLPFGAHIHTHTSCLNIVIVSLLWMIIARVRVRVRVKNLMIFLRMFIEMVHFGFLFLLAPEWVCQDWVFLVNAVTSKTQSGQKDLKHTFMNVSFQPSPLASTFLFLVF